MDLGGRKAGIMPGLGLLVPGRKRTGSERNQGILSRPTTMTFPALRPSRRVAPNETLSPPAKNTKIVETNSTNRLESTKPRKNELKTNSERSEKQRNKGAIRVKPSHAPPIAVRLFHLAKTCRAETSALADDGKLFFDDRSGNVIENKESRSSEVKELSSWEAEARGRRPDADGLSLFDSQLWTSQLEFGGTKRECL
jgi:hypothetical protein